MTEKPYKNPLLLFPTTNGRHIWRRYGMWRDGTLTILDGDTLPAVTAQEIAQVQYDENLILLVDDLMHLPIEQFLAFTEVNCDKRGTPLSIRITYKGGTTRWIYSIKGWGVVRVSLTFLAELREVHQALDVGTVGSPGGLGMRTLKATWKAQFGDAWWAHRHQRPTEACCGQIRRYGTGSRADLLTDQIKHAALIEVDIKNAFGAAMAARLPTGKVGRFFDYGPPACCVIWVAECHVTLAEPLPYGLFPLKVDGADTIYPTQPGEYATWLWSCQVELCVRHGLTVQVGDGWGWTETTTDCAAFVRLMEQLRDQASPALAGYFKLCLVAAIGVTGMRPEHHVLSLYGEDGVDIRVCADGLATEYFLKTTRDARPKDMPHWMYWILASVQCQLTEEAWTWIQRELLVADNVDAVLLKPEAEPFLADYPAKSEPGTPSGTWRKRTLRDARLPALRHLQATTADGETIDKRPGVAKKGRTS